MPNHRKRNVIVTVAATVVEVGLILTGKVSRVPRAVGRQLLKESSGLRSAQTAREGGTDPRPRPAGGR
jgi:hypothetical protein